MVSHIECVVFCATLASIGALAMVGVGILQPGHGSTGPRRIKGNFMEIGFIHNSTLRRAEEIIAQKESRQRVVVFCMADQLG